MTRVRTLVSLVALAVCIPAGGATAAPPPPSPDVVLKTATLAPDGSTWMRIMQEMDDAVREATSDRVGFRFYPGGVAGDEPAVLRKMEVGQIEAAGFTGVGLGQIVPRTRLLELPFQVEGYEDYDRLRDELAPDLIEAYREAGYRHLGWSETGLAYVFSNRRIRSERDVNAARPWVWEGDRLAGRTFEEFGIQPIPVALPDVLTSLQTGLIDTVYTSPLACIALQWHSRLRFMTDLPLGNGAGALLVSEEAWQEIPEGDREAVARICRAHSERLVEVTREENDEALEVLRNRHIRVVSVREGQVAHFREVGRTAARALVGELYSEEDLERALAVLDEE